MKRNRFEVATFDDMNDSNTQVVEGGLSFAKAKKLAKKMWASGEYFGVEVLDSDPDNMESIVWIMSKGEDYHFYVDIPQTDGNGFPNDEWKNVESFPTKKEAIAYAMKHFGADKNGCVSLISQS